MTTFDLKTHFASAVAANIHLWRRRLLEENEAVDRWWAQKDVVWEAVATGLALPLTQDEATALAVDLLPVLESWGWWFDWLPLLEAAAELDLAPDLQGRALLVQGRICFLNRNFKDAIRLLKTGLALAGKHQIEDLIAPAHFHLTNAYLGCKAYPQAREHGAKALDLLVSTTSTTLASLYNSLGLIELETGSFASGEDYFQKSLAFWLQLNEPIQMARTCLNLGVLYQLQSRWTEAKRCYKQANAALNNKTSVADKLKILNGLGTLHYMAEEFSAAEAVFRQGLAEVQGVPAVFHLRGSLTHNLGNTLLAMGRWGEARLYLEKCVVLWKQANDEVEQANSVGTLGELCEKQQAWTEAASYYNEALGLTLNYPDNQWAQKLAARFRLAIARCAAQTTANVKS